MKRYPDARLSTPLDNAVNALYMDCNASASEANTVDS